MYMSPVNIVEVQALLTNNGINYNVPIATNTTTPIQGQIVGCPSNNDATCLLAMYCLQLDNANYFDQTAPSGATNPFPASGDTTGYVDFNVWFPNLTLPVVNEPVVFWSTDIGSFGTPVNVCSSGNNGNGLAWSSSEGISQLSVMLYVYVNPFTATTPP